MPDPHTEIVDDLLAASDMIRNYLRQRGVPFREQLLVAALTNIDHATESAGRLVSESEPHLVEA